MEGTGKEYFFAGSHHFLAFLAFLAFRGKPGNSASKRDRCWDGE